MREQEQCYTEEYIIKYVLHAILLINTTNTQLVSDHNGVEMSLIKMCMSKKAEH